MEQNYLPDIVLTARDLSRLDLLIGRIAAYRSPAMVASLHDIPVEVVAEGAAAKLRQTGDIGAWLRSAEPPARRDLAAIRSRGGVPPVVG